MGSERAFPSIRVIKTPKPLINVKDELLVDRKDFTRINLSLSDRMFCSLAVDWSGPQLVMLLPRPYKLPLRINHFLNVMFLKCQEFCSHQTINCFVQEQATHLLVEGFSSKKIVFRWGYPTLIGCFYHRSSS